MVDSEFILSAVWDIHYEYGRKSLSTNFTNYYLETLDDLSISITATICTYVQQEENPCLGTKVTQDSQESLSESMQQFLLRKPENSFAEFVTLQMQDDVKLAAHRLILSSKILHQE